MDELSKEMKTFLVMSGIVVMYTMVDDIDMAKVNLNHLHKWVSDPSNNLEPKDVSKQLLKLIKETSIKNLSETGLANTINIKMGLN